MRKVIKARKWVKESREHNEKKAYMEYSENLTTTKSSFDFSFGEIMFWTGARDALGKEIYDSDILTMIGDSNKYLLSYFEDIARFYVIEVGTSRILYLDELDFNKLKVIGNYYETPELLKEVTAA